jgi:hypothetical protein
MIVECKDVSEVVRVLRWAADRINSPEMSVVFRKSNASNSVQSLKAGTFMSAVRSKDER